MENLKPCPFCRWDDIEIDGNGDGKFWAVCNDCHAEGPVKDSEEEAVKYWNHRI